MKLKYIAYVCLGVLFTGLFNACTDVVDVDVNNAPPRLVVEASIDWQVDTAGNEQRVLLSMSTDYFAESQTTPVVGATVTITNNSSGAVFVFNDQNNGSYVTSSFEPVMDTDFTLNIVYDGESYEATERFAPEVHINTVEQTLEGGFDDEVIDLNVYYNDDPDVDNFYMSRYYRVGDLLPYLDVNSDEFVNGNEVHDFFEIGDYDDSDIEPLQAGDVVDITIYSLNENFYNYMALFLDQAENAGNPFSTIPAPLIGNCKNTSGGTDPYGYFRTTRYDHVVYTVQ